MGDGRQGNREVCLPAPEWAVTVSTYPYTGPASPTSAERYTLIHAHMLVYTLAHTRATPRPPRNSFAGFWVSPLVREDDGRQSRTEQICVSVLRRSTLQPARTQTAQCSPLWCSLLMFTLSSVSHVRLPPSFTLTFLPSLPSRLSLPICKSLSQTVALLLSIYPSFYTPHCLNAND